jgi:hypothetical protein
MPFSSPSVNHIDHELQLYIGEDRSWPSKKESKSATDEARNGKVRCTQEGAEGLLTYKKKTSKADAWRGQTQENEERTKSAGDKAN